MCARTHVPREGGNLQSKGRTRHPSFLFRTPPPPAFVSLPPASIIISRNLVRPSLRRVRTEMQCQSWARDEKGKRKMEKGRRRTEGGKGAGRGGALSEQTDGRADTSCFVRSVRRGRAYLFDPLSSPRFLSARSLGEEGARRPRAPMRGGRETKLERCEMTKCRK